MKVTERQSRRLRYRACNARPLVATEWSFLIAISTHHASIEHRALLFILFQH